MSIKEQMSAEQWKLLFNAPSAASTYVSTASGGGLEMLSEAMTAGKFMQKLAKQATGSGYGAVVDELLGIMKTMSRKDAQAMALKVQSKDIAGVRAEVKQIVADAATAAGALPGGDGYKRWLVDMAREVALTKTGGFLGIGSKSVIDEKEQAALNELATMLGV